MINSIQKPVNIRSFVMKHKWLVLLGMVSTLFTTGALMVIPQFFRKMLDQALAAGDLSQLNQLSLAIVAIVLVMVVGVFVRMWAVRFAGLMIVSEIRAKLYQHIIKMPPSFFEERRTGEIISRVLSDVTVLREFIMTQLPQVARGFVLLFGSIAALLYTSVKLTLALLAIAPIIVFLAIILGKRWRQLSKEIQERAADIGVQIEESIGAIRTVQAFGQEQAEIERTNNYINQAIKLGKTLVLSTASFFSFNIFAGFAGVLLVVWLGGYQVISGEMTTGEMMAYVLYLAFLGDAVSNLSGFYPAMQMAQGATERVFELFNVKPSLTEPTNPQPLTNSSLGRTVELQNITFNYPSRPDVAALKHFSIKVEAGQTVALVGPSGAGKSTIFSLLMRFYDPQKGKVLLDNVAVNQLSFANLRGNLAVVSQDSMVFSTSILDNLRYGNPKATLAEVKAAAKIANADKFIEEMPHKYKTMVGEKGVRLSGGQKQRIAIARTILRNPQVLLLDEATSSLDAKSERQVQRALDKLRKGRTTLVIAHRLATVQAADKIVVMDEGQVIAEGTHAQLMKKCSLYKNLAELQFLE